MLKPRFKIYCRTLKIKISCTEKPMKFPLTLKSVVLQFNKLIICHYTYTLIYTANVVNIVCSKKITTRTIRFLSRDTFCSFN